MSALNLYRTSFFRRSVVYVVTLLLINISMDVVDPVQHQHFLMNEIESVFELVSEQLLGYSNCVSDQDESDVEKSFTSSGAMISAVDLVCHRTLSPDFKPILVTSLEASLLQLSFYSEVHRAKRTPPPRIA